jgi:hypothetical protein
MNEATRGGNPAFHRRRFRGTPQWKAHIICVPITLAQRRSDRHGTERERSRAHANAEKVPARTGTVAASTNHSSLQREIEAGFRPGADRPESASRTADKPHPDVATKILIPDAPHRDLGR